MHVCVTLNCGVYPARCALGLDVVKMAVVPVGKNKLKIGSAGRYYSAYLIYDVANSCLAALHAKMPPPVVVTRTNPPSPVHVQNPRKFSSLCFSIFRPGRKNLASPATRFRFPIHFPRPAPRDAAEYRAKEVISRENERTFLSYLDGKQIIYYLNNITWKRESCRIISLYK